MPSSYSASLRFELQFPGENINLWGDKLNGAFQRVDSAVAGWTTKALTGNYTLTTANGSADEARSAMLKFTGTGPYTVTIPSVSKRYDVWNAMSGALTLTTGAGATAILQAGETCSVMCDGSGVYRIQPTDFGGAKITTLGTPTANTDAATKAYVDGVAWSYNAGNLPALPADGLLKAEGSSVSWATISTSDLTDYETNVKGLAIAFATAL